MPPDPHRVAIVGGGISGLAAAYYLRRAGIETILFEPRPFLGGLLHTEYIQDCIVETGADSWLAAKPWAAGLARELGLELIGSNDAARRTLIRKNGRFIAFPEGMQLVAPTRFGPILQSPLLSGATKLRMLLDWFRTSPAPQQERSVAVMVRDHFSQEAVDYIAEPILSGIYGGSPEDLSAQSVLPKLCEHERKHGSLVRSLHSPAPRGPIFETVRDGLGRLVERLRPPNVIRARVEKVEPGRLHASGEWIDARDIIVACESHEAARIIDNPLLAPIRHSSAWITALGYPRLKLEGFGALIPAREGGDLMAATFMDNKFPHRVALGLSQIRAFFRERPRDPVASVRDAFGITADPLFVRSYEWPLSLPQYSVGHAQRVREIETSVPPGLHLIGNAWRGVGIPDCVRLAKEAAEKIIASRAV